MAAQLVERWRVRGFDTLICYKSGYCCPASSAANLTIPEGYRTFPLDSHEALEALRRSLDDGTTYPTGP